MVQDMSGKQINNYLLETNRILSFEDDTGPYLQYTHARLCSIMHKSGIRTEDFIHADFSLLIEQHVMDTLRLLAQYPDVTLTAYKTLELAAILTYLFKLCHQLSSGYEVIKVIGIGDEKLGLARAAYYEAVRQVINNGLMLLGTKPVQRYDRFLRDDHLILADIKHRM